MFGSVIMAFHRAQSLPRDQVPESKGRAERKASRLSPEKSVPAKGNLLVTSGCLSAVIDFGSIGVGDPACDLVRASARVGWRLLRKQRGFPAPGKFCANA